VDQLLTDAQRTFRDEIAAFAAEEIAPHVDEWEATKGFPTSAVRAAADRGLLGLVIPAEYGGRGVDTACSSVRSLGSVPAQR
jgi:alkylation response protein AidB-like acyl-CoA dehydrogenase